MIKEYKCKRGRTTEGTGLADAIEKFACQRCKEQGKYCDGPMEVEAG